MPLTPIAVKEYTALMNQSGTDAPVPTIEKNTIGNIVWTYDNTGIYIGTLNGAFPAGKVAIFIGNTYGGEYAYAGDINVAPNSIYINTYNYDGPNWVQANDCLTNTPITILVYN